MIPGLGRSPGEGNDYPLLTGEFHGQRSLARYSPLGQEVSDTTEWLTLYVHLKKNTNCLKKWKWTGSWPAWGLWTLGRLGSDFQLRTYLWETGANLLTLHELLK